MSAPQWNGGIAVGVAGEAESSDVWQSTRFFGALHGDVLFLRDGPRTIGIGPFLEVGTFGFSDLRALGGATALFPLGDLLAVAVRPGAYARFVESNTVPGFSARGWFGFQTYNYDGAYAPRGGLVFGYDRDFGNSGAHAMVIAAEVDGLLLALPAILLYEWLRGSPDDG